MYVMVMNGMANMDMPASPSVPVLSTSEHKPLRVPRGGF